MNWSSIILAALAGAIAAGIARLVADPRENKNTYVGTFVVLFGILFMVSRNYVVPHFEMRRAEAALREIPAFRAIKLYDSETYAALMGEVRASLESGTSREQIMAIFRKHVTSIVQKRLPKASDEAVVTYIGATMTEMDELYKRGDDSCHQFMFPRPGEVLDGSKYFSRKTQQADLVALAGVIESSARDPQRVPEESEIMPRFRPILEDLAGEYGKDIALMQNPAQPTTFLRRRVCQIASSLYTRILDLPAEDGGKILRYMVSQGT